MNSCKSIDTPVEMNIFINALWMAVAQPGDWTDQLQYQGARRRWPEADRNGGETAQADRVAWQKKRVFFLGEKTQFDGQNAVFQLDFF